MSWWQIALIILGSITVGLVVGYLLNYLIITTSARLRKRQANKPQAAAVVREPTKTVAEPKPATQVREPMKTVAESKPAASIPEPPKTMAEPKPAAAVREPPKTTVPDLFVEIESNRHIASQTRSGTLQAFQTKVWDTKRDEVDSLPAELREELTQAYFDMSLANSIVWLSTEMGRRSSSLDESYLKLCAGIADRLNRLKSSLEQLRLPQS